MRSEQEMVSGQTVEHGNTGELAAALAKAQGAMGAAQKSATNPHFRSKYADLAAVWDACRKPLSDNGLAVVQQVDSDEHGVTVSTRLIHASGQEIRAHLWLPVAQRTPQAYGSAITYGRRYGLASLVGVVADEDDDGNAASAGRPEARQEAEPPARVASKVAQVTAQLKAHGIEVQQEAKPAGPTLSFGPLKGRPIAKLTMEELSSALDAAHAKLDEAPHAKWAPRLRANLAELEAELERREREMRPAQMEMGEGAHVA